MLRNPPKPGSPINGIRKPIVQQKETENNGEKISSNLLTVPSNQLEVLHIEGLANAYI